MYKNRDVNSIYISIHDCSAEKMQLENGILSFDFSNGFWVLSQHPQNGSAHIVRTDASRVEYQIIDEEIDGIIIYTFKPNRNGEIVREKCEIKRFIDAVNNGSFHIEFIDEYKRYEFRLFKCMMSLDEPPYYCECEIIIHNENAVYCWNHLRDDHLW